MSDYDPHRVCDQCGNPSPRVAICGECEMSNRDAERHEKETAELRARLAAFEAREGLVQALVERVEPDQPAGESGTVVGHLWVRDLERLALAVRDFPLQPSAAPAEPCEYDRKCAPGSPCRVHMPPAVEPRSVSVGRFPITPVHPADDRLPAAEPSAGDGGEIDGALKRTAVLLADNPGIDGGCGLEADAVRLAAEVRKLTAERDQLQRDLKDERDELARQGTIATNLAAGRADALRERDQLRAERDEARAKVTKLRNLLSGALMDPG